MLLLKLGYAGRQVDRLVRDIGVVTLVGKKGFSSGEPSGVPYFKKINSMEVTYIYSHTPPMACLIRKEAILRCCLLFIQQVLTAH